MKRAPIFSGVDHSSLQQLVPATTGLSAIGLGRIYRPASRRNGKRKTSVRQKRCRTNCQVRRLPQIGRKYGTAWRQDRNGRPINHGEKEERCEEQQLI
jgi:hypothetical protein